jgi:cyclopropane fatty-acyl-phospholipid synthase-like methyltransferase
MKIDFEFETSFGKFADALWFPDGVLPSDQEIETMKQERLNNWIAIVSGTNEDVVEPVEEI